MKKMWKIKSWRQSITLIFIRVTCHKTYIVSQIYMKNTRKFTFASDGTVATTLLWSSGLQVFKVLASLSFAICSGQTFISPKPHFWLCAKTQCIIWSMWYSIFVTDQRSKKAHWHWHWFERPYSCQLGLQEICPCLANLSWLWASDPSKQFGKQLPQNWNLSSPQMSN